MARTTATGYSNAVPHNVAALPREYTRRARDGSAVSNKGATVSRDTADAARALQGNGNDEEGSDDSDMPSLKTVDGSDSELD